MHLPQSHHHPDPLRSLAPHLLLHLPYSLPIIRIIQHTAFNPDARIFSTLDPDDNTDAQQAWAAVYVERSRFPETECWLFSTFETWVNRRSGGSNGSPDADAIGEKGRREAEARVHMLSVLNDVAVHSSSLQTEVTLPTPNTPLILGTLNDALLPILAGSDFPALKPVEVLTREVVNVAVDGQPARNGTLSPLHPSSSSSSSSSSTTTTALNTNADGGVILGYSNAIHKFLIPPPPPAPSPAASLSTSTSTTTTTPSSSSSSPSLPTNYTFTTTLDLALAVSRSEIPRTVSGFRRLGAVGVRYSPHHRTTTTHPSRSSSSSSSPSPPPEPKTKAKGEGDLISWLFLSPDGSLQSLHVEPAHRGKGIAKAVCRRLMERLRVVPEEVGMRRLVVLPLPVSSSSGGPVGGRRTDGLRRSGGDLGGGDDEDDDDDDEIAARAMKEVGAEGWAHSDVLERNADGAGVARGIGGKAGWRVRWVGVDLERVRRVCASLRSA